MPESVQYVLPHGVDLDKFKVNPFPLKTQKKYKILANIAQPHIRKNLSGLLKAYGEAFTKKDDVSLILKISKISSQDTKQIKVDNIISLFKEKYPNHAEIVIIDYFINDIESLYNACDIVFTMTFAECFWMPGLEGFAANKIVLSPRYGGQLDYMNDENSLLIGGKEVRAESNMQYWEPSPYAKMFEPDIKHAAELLRKAVDHYDSLKDKFIPNINKMLPNYTWENVTKKLLELTR